MLLAHASKEVVEVDRHDPPREVAQGVLLGSGFHQPPERGQLPGRQLVQARA